MTELKLTEEIRGLGVSKVLVTNGKSANIYVYNGKTFAQAPFLKTELQRTLDALKDKMIYSGAFGDERAVQKIILLLSDLWVKLEENNSAEGKERKQSTYEKARAVEIETVNAEINRVKNANIGLTFEQWKAGLEDRYKELRNVIFSSIPEIWPGLEFELSSLRILNINDCNLPFIGIILGRPSSYKTIVINLLRKWYCTFYTDNFSPKSWITHTTAVETEEELSKIDMLPKIKDRHFLTPELAPLFTIKEDDLGLILGMITRIADGHGFGSDSGAHGHREYGDTMFVWTGAAVDIKYKVYKLLSGLGFKLYFFRLPYREKTEAELLQQLHENFNKKKANVEAALFDYLIWFEIGPTLIHYEQNGLRKMEWNTDRPDQENALKWIVRLATLLKHLRSIATTWETEGSQGSNYNYSVTQPESPERAIQILFNLAKGHALLTGRNYVTLEDIPIVVKTVLSTANIDKVGVLRVLIQNDGILTSLQIESVLNVARPTALRNMTELKAIGLVEVCDIKDDRNWVKAIRLKKDFDWLYSEEFQKLREGFEPVDNRSFMDLDSKTEETTDKEKQDPYIPMNDNSVDEILLFQQVYAKLEAEAASDPASTMGMDKATVSGGKVQEKLVSTGKFFQDSARQIIDEMVRSGYIEIVSWDTYRRVQN